MLPGDFPDGRRHDEIHLAPAMWKNQKKNPNCEPRILGSMLHAPRTASALRARGGKTSDEINHTVRSPR
jgi:hypothetical protein